MLLRVGVLAVILLLTHGATGYELAAGGAGWALQFDGVDDLAVLVDDLPPPPLTIELWVRPMDLLNGLGEPVVTYERKGALLTRYSAAAGQHLFSIQYNGAQVWPSQGIIIVDDAKDKRGTLYHYAFVLEHNRQFSIYINGSLAQSGSFTATDVERMTDTHVAALPWVLGSRMEYLGGTYILDDRCFGGQLDEMRWWNVTLGQEEIWKWMEVAPSPQEPGLVHRWSFDEPVLTGTGRLIEGGGDAMRSPVRVPSPLSLVGGPVAISIASNAPSRALRVCAAVTPAVSNATATATFDTTVGSTGHLGPPGGLAGAADSYEVVLQEVAATASRWCGEVYFYPLVAGEEQLPFVVEVQLPGGTNLSTTGFVAARVANNLPPVAGHAKALQTNGRDSYASLGEWDLPSGETDSHFSWSFWFHPSSVVDGSFVFSKHLANGANSMNFGLSGGGYMFDLTCNRGCNAGTSAPRVVSMFPIGADGAVLASGKTPEQIRAERGLPHLVTLTLYCHTRGNEDPVNAPARSTVTMYVDGYSIGTKDVGACAMRPMSSEGYDEDEDELLHPAPWEFGEEYDGGPPDEHLPGMAVTPSNFFAGVLDDLRFWRRVLTEDEVFDLARGVDVAESDLIVRYTFDLDNAEVCHQRQLAEGSISCYDVNEAHCRTQPTERFPFTNARIGRGALFVSSPFNKVRGSPMHRTMEAGSCASVILTGSDPDGDQLSFSLPAGFSLTGLSLLSGGVLQYCAPMQQTPQVDVEVPFDACDPLQQCASANSGFGSVIFHILLKGPSITHVQVVPRYGVLRLFFDEPTNHPPVSNQKLVNSLLVVDNLPKESRVMFADWEQGGQALRILISDRRGAGPANWVRNADEPDLLSGEEVNISNISVRLLEEGGLRNRAGTSFHSRGIGPSATVVSCNKGMRLPPDDWKCQGCPVGYYARNGAEEYCQICEAGWYAGQNGVTACEFCPKGRFTNVSGSSECEACDGVLPGSTTVPVASLTAEECVCPPGTAFWRDTPEAPPRCEPCEKSLLCLGGRLPNSTAHQPPVQQAGFFGGPQKWEGGPPSVLVECSTKERCPSGGELGTCPENTMSRACAECVSGTYPSGDECKSCSRVVGTFFALAVPLLMTIIAVALLGIYSTRSVSPYCDAVMTAAASAGLAVSTLQAFSALSGVSISWPEPLRSMREVLGIFAIQFDIIRPGCVFGTNSAVLSYLGSLAAYPCFATLLTLTLFLLRLRGYKVTKDSAVNAHGLAMMVAYLSVVVVSVLPMQCKSNPDGSQSVVMYRSVQCWHSREHIIMMVCAVLSCSILVVGFLSCSVWATVVYPSKLMQPHGIHFIVRFQFLFARFSPECFFFALVFSLRNLSIGLIPLLAEMPEVQLFLMAIVFVGGLGVQCKLWPWRARMANFLDAGFAFILTLTVVAGSMLGDLDPEDSQTTAQGFVVAGMSIAGVGTLLIIAYCLVKLTVKRRKYIIFLSHHKLGSGLLARWFKMLLAEEGYSHVFLDSDDVVRLDGLVDTVSNECDNIVLLLTRQTLARPWCAVEIACAHRAGTNIVPVACDDFEGVTDEFLDSLPQLWTDPELAIMTNTGVALDDVRKAYIALRDVPVIQLRRAGANTQEHRQAVHETLARCHGGSHIASDGAGGKITRYLSGKSSLAGKSNSMTSTPSASHHSTSTGSERVLISGNMGAPEAATACRVLQCLLQARLQLHVGLLSEVVGKLHTHACLIVVLTPGILENLDFAADLVRVHELMDMHLMPVLIGESFDFPNSDFWDRLSGGKVLGHQELKSKNINAERTKEAYRRLFNALALKFSGHGSTTVQEAELRALCARIRGLLASGSCAASGGVKESKFSPRASISPPRSPAASDTHEPPGTGDSLELPEACERWETLSI